MIPHNAAPPKSPLCFGVSHVMVLAPVMVLAHMIVLERVMVLAHVIVFACVMVLARVMVLAVSGFLGVGQTA